MPWLLRLAIGSLLLFVIGAVIIAWACVSTGWQALARVGFAHGRGRTDCDHPILSLMSAVINRQWRTFSVALLSDSVCCFFSCSFLPGLPDETSAISTPDRAIRFMWHPVDQS
jgi:amino acid transporter